VTYSTNKNVIMLMRAEKGKKVDWVQIMFNTLGNKLNQWYKYVKGIRGTRRTHVSQFFDPSKDFKFLFFSTKEQST
jgi:hypothetical protein